MMTEFAEIHVRETVKKKEETITYYILEDEKFGIKITKDSKVNDSENDELVLHDIIASRKEAEYVLEQLIRNNNDITQASYIIEDLLKNKTEQVDSKDETLIS